MASECSVERQQQKERQQVALRLSLTSVAAIAAESATFPIDITKTRLQLQGEMGLSMSGTGVGRAGGGVHRGALATGLSIAREEGVLGLYRGLSPALVRHVIYTSSRIVIYEHLRDSLSHSHSRSRQSGAPAAAAAAGRGGEAMGGSAVEKEVPVLLKAASGGLAGVVGQVIASPADLVKVRMQADGRLAALGVAPRYSNFPTACASIYREEGVRGLWRGVGPNAQRAALVNVGELACYDQAKRFVITRQLCDDNVVAHTAASVMSGLCATVLSCPADVVKTRMMNQGHVAGNRAGHVAGGLRVSGATLLSSTQYSSSLDCLLKTVRSEGVLALWKGFFPTWARLGPWQFVFWCSYEQLRKLTGLSSF
ncbi:hypothetical protein CBR_g19218 [Chara braunii]|uniref:Uncharacterized protein n=1 Tax=Chara braunii TaxID=69332 RepID=A0A388JTV6_CHABU|nr:hypothetical protein CBR_g19218 [Chara braunii]|eukprot:GBG61142.1 hypothetical protein CBR_g19218 [Chara braunii]